MRILWKSKPFLSFFLFESACVREWVWVWVCLRVLNIYDDDQLYQNVGKSITKKNWWKQKQWGGRAGRVSERKETQHRTNEIQDNERVEWMNEWMREREHVWWNEIKCPWGDGWIEMKTCGSVIFLFLWARISGSEGSSPGSKIASHHVSIKIQQQLHYMSQNHICKKVLREWEVIEEESFNGLIETCN